jgi:ribonuclease D
MTEEVQAPTPLLAPSAGLPDVIDTEELFSDAIAQLAQGIGPFALDAERASGYKFSARA